MKIRSLFTLGLVMGLALTVPGVAAADDDKGTAAEVAATAGDEAPAQGKDKDATLSAALSRSQVGLQEVYLPNGAVAIDLQGRFQVMMTARIQPDGTITYECTTDPHAVLPPEASDNDVSKTKRPMRPLVTE